MATTRIGIWGPQASGKTTYLTMLLYCKNLKVPLIPIGDTGAYLSRYYETLTGRGEKLPSTLVEELHFLTFHLDVPSSLLGTRRIILEVNDVAGEIFEDIERYSEKTKMIDYLLNSNGIIWFIDPDQQLPAVKERRQRQSWTSYREFFFGTLNKLYDAASTARRLKNGRLPQYMAFSLTKIDKYWAEYCDDPDALAKNILGKYWEQDIARFCDPDRCDRSAFSALGWKRLEDGTDVPNCNGTELLDPDNIKPYQIERPLEWLLEVMDLS